MYPPLFNRVNDLHKTKAQLVEELEKLRAEIVTLNQKKVREETVSNAKIDSETNGFKKIQEIRRYQPFPLGIIHTSEFGNIIYNESTDALFLVDPLSLLILDCNDRAVELFEATSKESLMGIDGHTLQKRLFTEVEIAAIVQGISKKGSWSQDLEYVTTKGKLFWGSLTAKPINILGHSINFVRIKDINDRKMAELMLQKREKMLAEAQQIAQIGNWEYEVATGEITWSAQLFQILERDRALGEPSYQEHLQSYPPEDAALLHQAVERAITTGESYHLPLRIIKSNGEMRYLENIGKVEINAEGQVVRLFGTSQDTTESVQAKQALQESEHKFRAIFNNMFQFIGLTSPDGILIEANQTALDFGGIQREDVIGRPFWEAHWWRISPETQEQLRQAVIRANQGEFVRYEVDVWGINKTVISIDFSLRPLYDENGQIVLLIPEGRDISDRKRAEAALQKLNHELELRVERRTAALQEFNRRWRYVLDTIQMIVVELDIEGYVQYVNPFFLKISQFTEEEVLGKSWLRTFIPPHLRPTIDTVFADILQKDAHSSYENPILLKSHEERMVSWNNSVLKDNTGQAIGLIALGEDITERHHLERLKAEFVSLVSHELRTPLTSMQAALSLLHGKFIDPTSSEGEASIAIASAGVDRLIRLVKDILDLERLRSGQVSLKKQVCSTEELIQTATLQMQEMAKQARITLNISPNSFSVDADRDRIIQVLINLLSNAIKFSSPHSSIDLAVAVQHYPVVDEPQKQPFLSFSVKDRGRGIPQENLETIFERFQQVDVADSREKGGTGLGLAICRDIVTQHGGKIWVDSILGAGSTFYFLLPMNNLPQ